MNILEQAKQVQLHSDQNKVLSENGAVMYAKTGNPLVNIDSELSSLRNKTPEEIQYKFEEAFLQDPKKAVKWMFMMADVREGKGERRTFDICMDYLARTKPMLASSLVEIVPEYTRWDHVSDLMRSNHKAVAKTATSIVIEQLRNDIGSEHPSLLAKWLPSIQTKKPEDRRVVFMIEKIMGWDHKTYRKTIAGIREHLNIIEKNMSQHTMDKLDQEKMTSGQQLKYGKALEEKLGEKRTEYLEKVEAGEAKMNAGAVNPDDVVYKYKQQKKNFFQELQYDATLENLWKNLKDNTGDSRGTIVVRDGSGSMETHVQENSNKQILDVADALSIYFAERQEGPLNNTFITFSNSPQIIKFNENDSLSEKLNTLYHYDDVSNTNIKAVFDLLLDTLQINHAEQKDVPENILILSDMEFDSCGGQNYDKTLFETLQDKWKEAGYEMPHLTFWNLSSRRALIPVLENDRGLSLMSGYSTNNLALVMSGGSPEKALDMVLDQDRYKEVERVYDRGVELQKEYDRNHEKYNNKEISHHRSHSRDNDGMDI